jgi:hypothetical protein
MWSPVAPANPQTTYWYWWNFGRRTSFEVTSASTNSSLFVELQNVMSHWFSLPVRISAVDSNGETDWERYPEKALLTVNEVVVHWSSATDLIAPPFDCLSYQHLINMTCARLCLVISGHHGQAVMTAASPTARAYVDHNDFNDTEIWENQNLLSVHVL